MRQGAAELSHAARHAHLFIRACAWCGLVQGIDFAGGRFPAGVSHGICDACAAVVGKQS
jgi:hypothetical protein